MDTKKTGKLGEDLACEYLVKKGFKILERNCVLFCGEIDIIVRKGGGLFKGNDKTIHFVEVKTLQGFYPEGSEGFFPEQRVDYKKQNKYKRLAEIWLSKNKMPENTPCQMDIIAVSMSGTDNKPDIVLFENVVEGA